MNKIEKTHDKGLVLTEFQILVLIFKEHFKVSLKFKKKLREKNFCFKFSKFYFYKQS